MRVVKLFNNSVLLAEDDLREFVVFGRGVGFGLRPGDEVDEAKIDRRFVPSETTSAEQIAALVQELPAEDMKLTALIVVEAKGRFGPDVAEHVFVPLADHLSFALRRAGDGRLLTEHPLEWEVLALYPDEVAFARRALEIVEAERGLRLPDIEAVPLALHFVNAQFGERDMRITMDLTGLLSELLDLIREEYGPAIAEDVSAVARFVTHLRHLFAREHAGSGPGYEVPGLADTMKASHAREYEMAERLAAFISERYEWEIREGEVAYMAIHVARLAAGVSGTARSAEGA